MLRNLLLALIVFLKFNFTAQNHVSWSFEYDNIMKKVLAYGRIDSTWHVYSSKTNVKSGAIPISFSFEKNIDAVQKGKLEEDGIPVSLKDPIFNSQVYQFENIYIAEIPYVVKKETTIKGIVSYMVCDNSKCLTPIDVPFTVQAKP
jgi:hypothetical protein